jgi:hypothetical protein
VTASRQKYRKDASLGAERVERENQKLKTEDPRRSGMPPGAILHADARSHSNGQTREPEDKALSQDHSQHRDVHRADSHPDADLPGPSADRKRDKTVQADDGEAESHQSHAADHRNQHPEDADRTRTRIIERPAP